MASVPKPPEGLAERIKRDIPNPLPIDPRADRDRLSQSIAFNMRVAASILLLVSCAYLMFHMASSYVGQRSQTALDMRSDAVAMKDLAPPQMTPPAPTPTPMSAAPSSVQTTGRAPAAPRSAAPQSAPTLPGRAAREEAGPSATVADNVAPPPPAHVAEPVTPAMEKQTEGVGFGVIGGTAGGVVSEAAAAPPPPAVAAAAPAPPPAQPEAARSRATWSIVPHAQADAISYAEPKDVFGISIDPNAFERVKDAIERGERPSASAVDVEALVNYFAGGARRAPRDVQLEVEGSPAPVAQNGRRAVLRYTIDTPRQVVPAGASMPPVATDVKVNIEFDTRAVASFRRVGGDIERHVSEPVLLKNLSVTALYEIELKPNVTVKQTVATVEVQYRRVSDGKVRKLTRILRVSDLSGPWTRASHRHRLASLGAVWGETLHGAGHGVDVAVAERAEELAKQAPKDARAQELAHLSEASTRM